MREKKKMPARTRDLLQELDGYISVLKSKKGNEPSFIGVTDVQFQRLKESSEFWSNKLWRVGDGLEYKGIPIRVVRYEESA